MHSISVAMATYNGDRFIREQLESIANQHITPDEIVICDDGSTDSTRSVLGEFATKHRHLTIRVYTNPKKLGFNMNFSRAFSLCNGDIIVPCDQDDIWLPNKLESIANAFATNVGLVFHNARVVDASGRFQDFTLWEGARFDRKTLGRSHEKNLAVMLKNFPAAGMASAFSGRLKDLVLPVDKHWAQDRWVAAIAAAVSDTVAIDQELTLYRQHCGQSSGGVNTPKRLLAAVGDRMHCQQRSGEIITPVALPSGMDHRLQPLLERLQSTEASYWDASRGVAYISDRIRHLNFRSDLPRSLFKRSAQVVREFAIGGYDRQSHGVAGALRDVVRNDFRFRN